MTQPISFKYFIEIRAFLFVYLILFIYHLNDDRSLLIWIFFYELYVN